VVVPRLISLVLLAVPLELACGAGFSPAPTPEIVAAMPDAIPCDRAVTVKAGSDRKGVDAERRWLDAFYPGHGGYAQALQFSEDHVYDVLTFTRANGRQASVCFDITRTYGRY